MKKIIGIALIAVAAVTAGWNFSQTQKEVELSDLALANVEALARGEVDHKDCPGGRHLCAWVNHTTYYDHNGPDDI